MGDGMRVTTRLVAFMVTILILVGLTVAQSTSSNFNVISKSGIPDILMVGDRAHPEVFLEEVSPDLTVKTTLKFDTGLDDPFWRITTYGETSETKTYDTSTFTFSFDHAAFDNMTIKLDGTAPEVEKKTPIVLMKIKIGDDVMTSISVDVTTEEFIGVDRAILDARGQITLAQEKITEAEDAGADVTAAKVFLDQAKGSLENARAFYDLGKMNKSKAAASDAYGAAVQAYNSAEKAMKEHAGGLALVALGKYGIIAGIVIALLIVAVIAVKRRRWDRLG